MSFYLFSNQYSTILIEFIFFTCFTQKMFAHLPQQKQTNPIYNEKGDAKYMSKISDSSAE